MGRGVLVGARPRVAVGRGVCAGSVGGKGVDVDVEVIVDIFRFGVAARKGAKFISAISE